MHRKVVPDIVNEQRIELLPAGTTVRDAARNMAERHIGAVLVGTPEHLEGIFTERDIVALVADEDADARPGEGGQEEGGSGQGTGDRKQEEADSGSDVCSR